MFRPILTLAAAVLLASCKPLLLKVETVNQVQTYVETRLGTVSTPVFSVASGSYPDDTLVSLTADPAGASFRYTTDGSQPSDTHGNTYTEPFALTSGTVKAVGYKDGYATSAVAARTYTVHPAGTHDSTFGDNVSDAGVFSSWDYDGSGGAPTLPYARFQWVGMQSSGKILAGGYFNRYYGTYGTTNEYMTIARVPAAGNGLDYDTATGFGTATYITGTHPRQGYYERFPITPNSRLVAAAVQGDDQVVLAETVDGDWRVERIVADGTQLDSSFGTSGVAEDPFPLVTVAPVFVVVQSNGKILVAGNSSVGSYVVRYTASGALDTGYGTGGIVTFSTGSSGPLLVTLLPQSDGKTIAVGNLTGHNETVFSARIGASGQLDTTWGGVVAPASGVDAHVEHQRWNNVVGTSVVLIYYGTKTYIVNTVAAALQSDGKVMFAASTDDGSDLAYGRIGSDGLMDTTYNPSKMGTFSINGVGPAAALKVTQTDKTVIALPNGKLYRIQVSGSLDSTFNGSGTNSDLASGDYTITSMALAPNGQIVLAGYSNSVSYSGDQGNLFRFW